MVAPHASQVFQLGPQMERGPVFLEAQPRCPRLQARGPSRARPLQTHFIGVLRIQDLRAAGAWQDRTAHLGSPR